MLKFLLLVTGSIFVVCGPASAYAGPGLGLGTIAVVLGFFASIFIALFAIIWYPIKRMLRRGKKKPEPAPSQPANTLAEKDD